MAVRAAGVRLEIQNLAQYLNGSKQVDDANKRTKENLIAVAEAEKRATIEARTAAQQRTQAARAEAQERIQAARAATSRITEEQRRLTASHRSELQQQVAASRQAAREQAAAQRAARQEASGQPSFTDRISSGVVGGLGRSALGLGLGFVGLQGIQQTLGTVVELDQLRGRANSANIALIELAGGSGQAAAAIRAIQQVAPGSTSALEATEAAVTILTQKLPSAAVGLEDIARFAALVPRISPSISSSADALAQLTLFASSNAFARADQLGVTAQDVKNRMAELAATYPQLSDAQIKAAATVQLVNERFAGLGAGLAESVTGVQKLSTAWTDLKTSIATGSIGPVDNFLSSLASGINNVVALFDNTRTADLRRLLQDKIAERQASTEGPLGGINELFTGGEQQAEAFRAFLGTQELINRSFEAGVPGAEAYRNQINELIQTIITQNQVYPQNIEQLQALQQKFLLTLPAVEAFTAAEERRKQAQAESEAATNLAELNETRQQIDELTRSSIELAAQGAPGFEELSKALLNLQTHLASSTQLSEEDAAAVKEAATQHQLLAAAAGQSVGNLNAAEQAKLNDSVAAYQAAQANRTLEASLRAVADAQAGVARGIVSDISGLIGSGLINAGQAGALNTAINARAQAGFAGIQARGLTGPALTFATAQLEREITEPFRQLQQIEIDMTREAQEQHRAAQGASKEWNKAQKDAEKAARATAKALESVEGLFSPSKVTEQQLAIAEAGGAVNLPDDFLRRFRDVSENFEEKGFRDDFGQQQLDEARAALQRIGIQPLEDLKGLFAQFEQAWSNLSLFASEENLALINQQAVQDSLRLQEQMEQGRKNIYKLFGVTIEDATEAVSGGGGVPPIDQEALQQRIQDAQQAFIQQILMGLGVGPGGTSDAALATIVTGAGGGQSGGLDGLRQGFDNTTSTADILRGTFDEVTTTADILRESFLKVDESSVLLASKLNDIPPVIWENHIDTFPGWQGEEGVIDPFPGWEAWLGAEKANTGATDLGATSVAGTETVPSLVQQSLTSPSVTNNTSTRTTNVTINTHQSTGSLITDWAIMEHQAR